MATVLNRPRKRDNFNCRNHDPLRAGGEHRRCPERNIRADELDTFVFEQVRDALLRPDVLLSGEHAVSARREPAADELLQAQLAKLQRKIDAVAGERRRLADLYQAAFIEREELLRRGNELCNRGQHLQDQRDALIAQRTELAHQNTLRQRIAGFSAQVGAAVDDLDFEQRQKLLRLVVEHVFVRGWRVEIQLRIPLDEPPPPPDRGLSSKDRLRSLGRNERGELPPQPQPRAENGSRGLITTPSSAAPSPIPTPSDHLTPTAAVAVFCSALWSGFSPPLTALPRPWRPTIPSSSPASPPALREISCLLPLPVTAAARCVPGMDP